VLSEIEEIVDVRAVRECDSTVKAWLPGSDKKLIDRKQGERVMRAVRIPTQHQQPARLEYLSESMDRFVLLGLSIQSIPKDAINKSHIKLTFRIEACNTLQIPYDMPSRVAPPPRRRIDIQRPAFRPAAFYHPQIGECVWLTAHPKDRGGGLAQLRENPAYKKLAIWPVRETPALSPHPECAFRALRDNQPNNLKERLLN
jgi:hypothetical protein